MKKILFLALTSMAFAAKTVVPSAPALDSDGCYAISNTEELFGFADIVNASDTHDECGKLTKDIIVNTGWTGWQHNPWKDPGWSA